MPNFLVVGDPHFASSESAIRRNKLMSEEIFRVVEENKPEFVVLLGDILDKFSPGTRTIDRSYQFINHLSTLVDKLYILIGNHDIPNNQYYPPNLHAFNSYKISKNVVIVDEPTEFSYQDKKFLAVPYYPTGKFYEILHNYDFSNYDVLFSHQEYLGSFYGGKHKSTKGDEIPSCKITVNGHIHTHELLENGEHLLINVGSPIQHKFGDSPNNALLSFNLDNLEWERIEINVPKKVDIKVSAEFFDQLDMSQVTRDTKITLLCKVDAVPSIESSEKIKQIREVGASLIYSLIKDEQISELHSVHDCETFGSYFKKRVDKDLLYIYNDLFTNK